MNTASLADDATSVHIQFEDNNLLPILFGAHDKHLVRIEQQLGVSLTGRGNHVSIAGSADATDMARTTLCSLYEQVKDGETVNESDVDAAMRMARGGGSGERALIQLRRKRVAARSPAQTRYIQAMQNYDLVFARGPAGTGKTYLAVCAAVEMFSAGKIERIILSRPAVEAGERLGFLPGDMQEKIDPYLRPLFDALHETLPGEQVVRRLASGDFEVAPLAFMRGRTLSNAFVILDEAQNTTPTQMKMFLTRLGENSRMVVTGDLSQVDLPPGTRPGLRDAVDTLAGVGGVQFVHFSAADVVRPPLVARIIRAYEVAEKPAIKNP